LPYNMMRRMNIKRVISAANDELCRSLLPLALLLTRRHGG
jgi:hypothetical protein